MISKKALLNSIYKYYPSVLNKDNNQNNKIEKLREKKIKDKNKFFQKEILENISDIARGYAVIDWTEKDSCCYEFKILLHKYQPILDDDTELIKALNGIRNDLRIFISILEPYYFCFIEETKYVISKDEWIFKRIETKDNEIKSMLNKINKFFSINGYTTFI